MNIDFQIFTHWLQNSALGILLLGAAGSIAATAMLALSRKLLLEFIPSRYAAIRYFLIRRSFVSGFVMGQLAARFEKGNSIEGYFVYFSYLVARLIGSSCLLILMFMIFLYSIDHATSQLLTYSSFISAFLCFIFIFDINSTANIIYRNYEYLVKPILERAEDIYPTKKIQKTIFNERGADKNLPASAKKTRKKTIEKIK